MLIQVTHRITVKAERRVVEELVEEAREVRGKAGILFRVAEAAIGRPEGVVREVIFPVVGEPASVRVNRTLRALSCPDPTSPKLRVPDNISLLPLPRYSPELNPVENL